MWSCVIQKLTESQTSGLSAESMEEHLYLIKKLLPDWISVVEIRKKRYVKINKNTDTGILNNQLEAARYKLSQCSC